MLIMAKRQFLVMRAIIGDSGTECFMAKYGAVEFMLWKPAKKLSNLIWSNRERIVKGATFGKFGERGS